MQNLLTDLIFDKQKTVLDTSKESYKKLNTSGEISNRQQEYINILRNVGKPSTDQEITRTAGYKDPNYFRPRRKELYDMGLIIRGDKRKCRITNRTVYTWYLKNDMEVFNVML